MPLIVCDIDGVIINQIAMMRDITKDYSFDPDIWELPKPYNSLVYVSELMPPSKTFYYPKMVSILDDYFTDGYNVFFITSRPKILNFFTMRSLKYIFPQRDFTLINSKVKYDGCSKYYRDAETFFEDSPLLFPKLFKLNNNGVLVKHKYNRKLWGKYPSINPI
jgi:hypothetical protein